MLFQIEIKETLSKLIEVNTESEDEALSKVEADYKAEKIVLDYVDYQTNDFCLYNEI